MSLRLHWKTIGQGIANTFLDWSWFLFDFLGFICHFIWAVPSFTVFFFTEFLLFAAGRDRVTEGQTAFLTGSQNVSNTKKNQISEKKLLLSLSFVSFFFPFFSLVEHVDVFIPEIACDSCRWLHRPICWLVLSVFFSPRNSQIFSVFLSPEMYVSENLCYFHHCESESWSFLAE